MIAVAFDAKVRAAETDRKRALALALEQAKLIAFAFHDPKKMPSLSKLLGTEPARQSGNARRSMMKAFIASRGGKVTKKGAAT